MHERINQTSRSSNQGYIMPRRARMVQVLRCPRRQDYRVRAAFAWSVTKWNGARTSANPKGLILREKEVGIGGRARNASAGVSGIRARRPNRATAATSSQAPAQDTSIADTAGPPAPE